MNNREEFERLKQRFHEDFVWSVQCKLEEYNDFNGTINVKYDNTESYEKEISREEFLNLLIEQMIDDFEFMHIKIDLADRECNPDDFVYEDESTYCGPEEDIKQLRQEIEEWREKQDKKMQWFVKTEDC